MNNTKTKIPVVKRKVVFSDEDILNLDLSNLEETQTTETSIMFPLHVYDDADTSILQIVKSQPLIMYYNENILSPLDSYVLDLALSSMSGSKIFFNESFDNKEEFFNDRLIATITKNNTHIFAVNDDAFLRILSERPDLIVSPEGYLVFYTDAEMYITLDGLSGTLITHSQIKEAASYNSDHDFIKKISVNHNGLTLDLIRQSHGNYVKCTYKLNIQTDFIASDQAFSIDLTLKNTRSL